MLDMTEGNMELMALRIPVPAARPVCREVPVTGALFETGAFGLTGAVEDAARHTARDAATNDDTSMSFISNYDDDVN